MRGGMDDREYREIATAGRDDAIEYDLADAIYAACLVDSLRDDSSFYFMDDEDGHTSMVALAA